MVDDSTAMMNTMTMTENTKKRKASTSPTIQMETMDIGFGDFTNLKINDYVSATGTLDLPPNGYADVSARATGFVRNSRNYVEGDYVKKGATLGYLENPDFIDHQQRYLESDGRAHLPA